MKYVSIAESRAGSDKESHKPRKRAQSQPDSVTKTDSTTPDGGSSASKSEED